MARLEASTASGQSSIAPAASARPSCAIASRAYIGTDASPESIRPPVPDVVTCAETTRASASAASP